MNFDLGAFSTFAPILGNVGNAVNNLGIGEKLENATNRKNGIIETISAYFMVDTALIGRRLSLLAFPFKNFVQRSEKLPLDMYLPLTGYLAMIVVDGLHGAYKEGFTPYALFMSFLWIFLILFIEILFIAISERLGWITLTPTEGQEFLYTNSSDSIESEVKTLDIISLAGYKLLFVAICGVWKIVVEAAGIPKIVAWIPLVYFSASIAVHHIFHINRNQLKSNESQNSFDSQMPSFPSFSAFDEKPAKKKTPKGPNVIETIRNFSVMSILWPSTQFLWTSLLFLVI